MSNYFSTYAKTLENLANTISGDVESAKSSDLANQLISFRKDVLMLIAVAYNNSAIESKASKLPENAETHWWAGSGSEPEQSNP